MYGGRFRLSALSALTSVGLLAMAGSASAADLGGDCCADLEERVAELEATTVRKGNRKVSLKITGWVSQALLYWDDGEETNVYVVQDTTDLASNVSFTGTAKINSTWSAGYLINVFFDDTSALLVDQTTDDSGGGLTVQRAKWWIENKRLGKVSVGLQSAAGDNVSILPDFSGTLFAANNVIFDGAFFFLRPEGGTGLASARWQSIAFCNSIGLGIAGDCNGLRTNAVRYDTPTFAGFSASASWGEDDKTEFAVRYAAKSEDWQFSGAVGYGITNGDGLLTVDGVPIDTDYFQAGAMIKHLRTNLWIYSSYAEEDTDNATVADGYTFYLKTGWSPKLNSLGTTHFWFEYGKTEGQYGFFETGSGRVCAAFDGTGANLDAACASAADTTVDLTGSEITRFGVGVQQQIDAAAMQIYAKWRMMDGEVDFNDNGVAGSEDFEDLQMFMVGGVLFF